MQLSILCANRLEWCFFNEKLGGIGKKKITVADYAKDVPTRGTGKPRRITVKIATAASERVIGRALSFAKPGETFDLVRAYHHFEPKLRTLTKSYCRH